MPSAAVDILRCPACGADVPLGQAEPPRCAHCGAAVPVPEAHRELRSLSLVLGTLLLIVVLLRSLGSDERAAEEARLRRAGSGLPRWVRVAGPLGFWAVLWLIRLAVWH